MDVDEARRLAEMEVYGVVGILEAIQSYDRKLLSKFAKERLIQHESGISVEELRLLVFSYCYHYFTISGNKTRAFQVVAFDGVLYLISDSVSWKFHYQTYEVRLHGVFKGLDILYIITVGNTGLYGFKMERRIFIDLKEGIMSDDSDKLYKGIRCTERDITYVRRAQLME